MVTIRGIKLNGFETAKEAAIMYDRDVLKSNRSTSLLNFPDMVHNLDVEPKRKKQKVRSDNKTGYTGVSQKTYGRSKKVITGRFVTHIFINGKVKTIGTFDSAIGAALAYDQAAIKRGSKSYTLNFPPMDQQEKKKQKKQKKQKEKKEKKEKKKQKKQKKEKKKELTLQEYKEMLQASL